MIYEKNLECLTENIEIIKKNNLGSKNKRLEIPKSYIDADMYDEKLYEMIRAKLDPNGDMFLPKVDKSSVKVCSLLLKSSPSTHMGCDSIIGLRTLFAVFKDDWINKYETIHKNINGTFIWPRDGSGCLSLNCCRYVCFRDRPDHTIKDIESAFKHENLFREFKTASDLRKDEIRDEIAQNISKECLMRKSLGKGKTLDWLLTFSSFKNFIDVMQLNWLVTADYEVIDIQNFGSKSNGLLTKAAVDSSLPDAQYLTNLLTLLENAKEKERNNR